MRICVYIPTASFYVGGGEVIPLIQARQLQKIGHEVAVVTLKVENETNYFKAFKKDNPSINYCSLSSIIQKENPFDKRVLNHQVGHELYFSLTRAFSYYCLKQQFDIVITHYCPAAMSVPSSIKQLLFLHGVPSEFDLVNYVSARLANKLVAVSNSVAQGWQSLFQLGKIEVLHNGIDEKTFYPENLCEDIDIFFVGRLIEIKGVQHLIEAVSILDKEYNIKAKVVIRGEGPYERELVKLTRKLRLESQIEFLGYIKEENLNSYYNRSKICVFPSYAKEGVLTTMLEAASAGRAIITTNSCGMVDFLKDKDNGLLFEPENPKDLSLKIKELLTEPTKRKRFGEKARKDILASWTLKKSTFNLELVLKKMVK